MDSLEDFVSLPYKVKIAKLEAQNKKLVEWAKDKHPEWCGHYPIISKGCTCGLDELIKEEK